MVMMRMLAMMKVMVMMMQCHHHYGHCDCDGGNGSNARGYVNEAMIKLIRYFLQAGKHHIRCNAVKPQQHTPTQQLLPPCYNKLSLSSCVLLSVDDT